MVYNDGDAERVQLTGKGARAFGLSPARSVQENVGGKTLLTLAKTRDLHLKGIFARSEPLDVSAGGLTGIVAVLASVESCPMLTTISSLIGCASCPPCSHRPLTKLTLPSAGASRSS
jgi:hypothetical protein